MEQLEILEAKIKEIVEKSKLLSLENEDLKESLRELRSANTQLEDSLLRKSEILGELTSDRNTTKIAIDELVSSLNALSSSEQ
jgi:FtsZ-binding cell division protein ZapB